VKDGKVLEEKKIKWRRGSVVDKLHHGRSDGACWEVKLR
jgi:hypothetical protein